MSSQGLVWLGVAGGLACPPFPGLSPCMLEFKNVDVGFLLKPRPQGLDLHGGTIIIC